MHLSQFFKQYFCYRPCWDWLVCSHTFSTLEKIQCFFFLPTESNIAFNQMIIFIFLIWQFLLMHVLECHHGNRKRHFGVTFSDTLSKFPNALFILKSSVVTISNKSQTSTELTKWMNSNNPLSFFRKIKGLFYQCINNQFTKAPIGGFDNIILP